MRMRFNLLPREAASYVQLRKKGYSINMIARAFGRSTSIVYRILKLNIDRGLYKLDLRKMPHPHRSRLCRIRWKTLQKYLFGWEIFALGEGDKPP